MIVETRCLEGLSKDSPSGCAGNLDLLEVDCRTDLGVAGQLKRVTCGLPRNSGISRNRALPRLGYRPGVGAV